MAIETKNTQESAMSHINMTYTNALQSSFLLNYLGDENGRSGVQRETRQRTLYELANAKIWNVKQQLDWDMSQRCSGFPDLDGADPLTTYPPCQSLPREARRSLSWTRHAMELSDILHGEQAALLLSAQLLSVVPNASARLFMSSQVSDEARHVDFFIQYMVAAELPISPPNPQLASIIQDSLQSADWRYKFSACQILIESLALARFRELRISSRVPALRQGLALILQDEARHVKFGTDILSETFAKISPAERDQRGTQLLRSAMQLIDTTLHCRTLSRLGGWEGSRLRLHLRQHRLRHPDIARNRLRQLRLNMNAAGLLTDNVRRRFDRISNPTNS